MIENKNIIENLEYSQYNIDLFKYINNFSLKNDFFDYFSIFAAKYLLLIIGLIFFIFFTKRIWSDNHVTLKELVIYFSGAILSYAVTYYLKNNFDIIRPFLYLDIKTLLTHKNTLMSFPSGHTTFAFALAMSTYLYSRKLGKILLFFAVFVGLSRIVVGVHYPLDILTGALIGIFFPATIFFLLKIFNIKDVNNYYGSEEWKRKRKERKESEKIFTKVETKEE